MEPQQLQQPPYYGVQAPPPPISLQAYSPPPPGQTYSPPSQLEQLDRSQSGQQHQQPQMQQAQYAPQRGQDFRSPQHEQYARYSPQSQYGQVPQQANSQFPQQLQQQHPVQEFRTAVPLGSLTSSPAPVQCPNCGQRAITMTTFVVGNSTHGWAIGLCVLLCLGCIPYLISSMKDVEHRCSKCGVHLATWHRSGRTEVKLFA